MQQHNKNYVFYDLETSGLSKQFDQILQFGAILTDGELKEIDRLEVRCRLQTHIIPSPRALQVTRVSPANLVDERLPTHYQAIHTIYKKLSSWSPAIFFGYNSISFDEEFLRQAFYQTLHPCYLTNTNGNSRGDILRLMHAVHILAPDTISPVYDDKGRARFMLDQLAPNNGFLHEQAHDAMADVEATIYLAKQVLDEAPHVWDMLLATGDKKSVQDMLSSQEVIVLCSGSQGGTMSGNVITSCGINPLMQNQHGVFDLNYDPEKFFELDTESLRTLMSSKKSPIRKVYTNRQPILVPMDDTPEHLLPSDMSSEDLTAKARLIRKNTDFRLRVSEAMVDESNSEEETLDEVELQIYEGFANRADSSLMEKFHQESGQNKIGVLRGLEDLRMKRLAQRLLYFEHPELLSDKVKNAMKDKIHERLTLSEEVPWRTVDNARAELEGLKELMKGPEGEKFVRDYESLISSWED